MSNRVKLQFRNKKQFVITLPKAIVVAKRWKKGDSFEIILGLKSTLILSKSSIGPKLQHNTQFILTLPKSLVMALGWKKNDALEFTFENEKLKLKRITNE